MPRTGAVRSMAEAMGISAARACSRIWARSRPQAASHDAVQGFATIRRSTRKSTDIVGLYLDPPDKALVLCVDEKSQIQALDRTQPGLPLKKGRAATMTHDYKRNGTTTLFAALDVESTASSSATACRAIGHEEFLPFLQTHRPRAARTARSASVLDNYATHKTPEVKRWLARHPRFTLHFTPTIAVPGSTSSSGFFAEITRSASAAALLQRRRPGRRRSTATSALTTPNRSPSSGPNPPKISSPENAARWTPSMKSVETGRKHQNSEH